MAISITSIAITYLSDDVTGILIDEVGKSTSFCTSNKGNFWGIAKVKDDILKLLMYINKGRINA